MGTGNNNNEPAPSHAVPAGNGGFGSKFANYKLGTQRVEN